MDTDAQLKHLCFVLSYWGSIGEYGGYVGMMELKNMETKLLALVSLRLRGEGSRRFAWRLV